MNRPDADTLARARRAIAAQHHDDARRLLAQAIKENPGDHRPWLWLAGIAPSPAVRRASLARAAAIAPNDPTVLKAQRWLAKNERPAPPADVPSASRAAAVTDGLARAAADQQLRQRHATAVRPPALHQTGTVDVEPTPRKGETAVNPQESSAAETPNDVQGTAAPAPAVKEIRAGSARRPARRIALVTAGLLLLVIISGALAVWQGQRWLARQDAPQAAVSISTPESTATPSPAGTLVATAATFPDVDADADAGGSQLLINPPAPTATPAGVYVRYQPKGIAQNNAAAPRATWTVTPSPTNTPTPTITPSPTPSPFPTFVSEAEPAPAAVIRPAAVGASERWVDVNLTTQTLNALEGDSVVFQTSISSGLPQWPTVTGQFRIYLTYESQTMDGRYLGYDYYLPNVPYVLYFYQGYALHGTYWHNNFGTPMSHGCVNMETSDAQWIYNWAGIGTLVNVHY